MIDILVDFAQYVVILLNSEELTTPLDKIIVGALFGLAGGIVKSHINKENKRFFPSFYFVEIDSETGFECLEKATLKELLENSFSKDRKRVFKRSGRISEILISPLFGALSVFLLPIIGKTTVVGVSGLVFGYAGIKLFERVVNAKIKEILNDAEENIEKVKIVEEEEEEEND